MNEIESDWESFKDFVTIISITCVLGAIIVFIINK